MQIYVFWHKAYIHELFGGKSIMFGDFSSL